MRPEWQKFEGFCEWRAGLLGEGQRPIAPRQIGGFGSAVSL